MPPALFGQSSRRFSFVGSPLSVGQRDGSEHVIEATLVDVQMFNLPVLPLCETQQFGQQIPFGLEADDCLAVRLRDEFGFLQRMQACEVFLDRAPRNTLEPEYDSPGVWCLG